MEGNEREPMRTGRDAPAGRPGVHVRLRGDGQLELRFERGFTPADVAAVKSIRGRRWVVEQLVWQLPHTAETWSVLTRSFGSRLVQSETPTSGSAVIFDEADVGVAARTPRDTLASTSPAIADAAARTSPETPASSSPAVPEVQRPRPQETASPGAFPFEAEAALDAMRRVLRTREYSRRTEQSYLSWIRRFFEFHAAGRAGVESLDASPARAFLEHLATSGGLAAKSRNQAASALGFMFREIRGRDEAADIPRAKVPSASLRCSPTARSCVCSGS